MNSLTDEEWSVIGLGLCFGVFMFWCGGCVMREHYQKEAVKHGAATWEVHDDGSTTFKWREGE